MGVGGGGVVGCDGVGEECIRVHHEGMDFGLKRDELLFNSVASRYVIIPHYQTRTRIDPEHQEPG